MEQETMSCSTASDVSWTMQPCKVYTAMTRSSFCMNLAGLPMPYTRSRNWMLLKRKNVAQLMLKTEIRMTKMKMMPNTKPNTKPKIKPQTISKLAPKLALARLLLMPTTSSSLWSFAITSAPLWTPNLAMLTAS